MSRYEAAEAYGISRDTARDYMRLYRDYNSLPPKSSRNKPGVGKSKGSGSKIKKGYEVKGYDQAKEYILLDSSNIK